MNQLLMLSNFNLGFDYLNSAYLVTRAAATTLMTTVEYGKYLWFRTVVVNAFAAAVVVSK
jgi:hypothetical protein